MFYLRDDQVITWLGTVVAASLVRRGRHYTFVRAGKEFRATMKRRSDDDTVWVQRISLKGPTMPHHGKLHVMSFGLGGNHGDGVSRSGNTYSSSWYLGSPEEFVEAIPSHYDAE